MPVSRKRIVSTLLAVVLLASTLFESPPWSAGRAPVIEEAEWDVPVSVERRAVTRCLAPAYGGEKVLASMGSLAHYMQELSAQGFAHLRFRQRRQRNAVGHRDEHRTGTLRGLDARRGTGRRR